MRTTSLAEADIELIEHAEQVLKERYVADRHRCSAALRMASGRVYTGINLITGGQADVHSEQVAYGNAVTNGERDVETSVAVVYEDHGANNQMQIVSACGHCREFFRTFAPTVDIVVPTDDGGPAKASLSVLLPAKR